MSRLTALLLIFSLAPTVSLAQDAQEGGLEKCVAIPEDTVRLACFDAYAAQVRTQNTDSLKAAQRQADNAAQVEEEQRLVEKTIQHEAEKAAQAKEEQRQKDFGLTDAVIARREAQKQAQKEAQKEVDETQSSEPVSKPAKASKPEPENMVAHVKEFTRNNRTKRIRITLDNGQVWQEIDGKPFRGSVKPGTEVTITKRPIAGYKITVSERSSSILVRRLK
jgi:hypothetical protein